LVALASQAFIILATTPRFSTASVPVVSEQTRLFRKVIPMSQLATTLVPRDYRTYI
jgi:hypothetical protein